MVFFLFFFTVLFSNKEEPLIVYKTLDTIVFCINEENCIKHYRIRR